MAAIIQVEVPFEALAQQGQVGRQQQRTVDEVVRARILHGLPGFPLLPEDIETELAAFERLSDELLWLVADTTLSVAQQSELLALNDSAQRRELTPEEKQHQQELLNVYERVIVRRAQAAAILKSRGH